MHVFSSPTAKLQALQAEVVQLSSQRDGLREQLARVDALHSADTERILKMAVGERDQLAHNYQRVFFCVIIILYYYVHICAALSHAFYLWCVPFY